MDVPNPLSDLRAPAFGLRAGVDLSIPLVPVPDVTFAADLAFSEAEGRGTFRAAPFELLPIPTLQGSFWVSGYGRNLQDDDGAYDDGAYGELDPGRGYLSGTGRFAWEDNNGRASYAQGRFVFDSERGYLFVDGGIDWSVPFAGGRAGVTGAACYRGRNRGPGQPDCEILPDAPEQTLLVEGDVVVFGWEFAGVDVAINDSSMRFQASWAVPDILDLPDGITNEQLAAAQTSYVLDWAEGSFCGTAGITVLGEACTARLCLRADRTFSVDGCGLARCDDGICANIPAVEECGADDTGPSCNSDCGLCGVGGTCNEDADCRSGNCVGFLCVPSIYCGDGTCENLPAVEECGRGNSGNVCQRDCGLCPLDALCDSNDDCVSGECKQGQCAPRCGDRLCQNSVRFPAEELCGKGNSGAVCETDCGLCGDGQGPCDGHEDCRSGLCLGVACAPRSCGNGTCDGALRAEVCGSGDTSPSCQSDCGKCDSYGPCDSNADCLSGSCVAGLCAPRCGDNSCDEPAERCGSGVDPGQCRSDCGRCPEGVPCLRNSDCASGQCANLAPNTPGACAGGCGDGVCLAGFELCGVGTADGRCQADCGLCPEALPCRNDADCSTGNCVGDPGLCGPRLPVCGDGRCANVPGLEECGSGNSGASCERDCGKCGVGGTCNANSDCVSGLCLGIINGSGFCAGCGDGTCTALIEGCGSGNSGLTCERDCGKCGHRAPCNEDADCRSNNCTAGTCHPRCGDRVCDFSLGIEECGSGNSGAACQTDCGKCAAGGTCNEDADCRSDTCFLAVCL